MGPKKKKGDKKGKTGGLGRSPASSAMTHVWCAVLGIVSFRHGLGAAAERFVTLPVHDIQFLRSGHIP